MYMKNLTKKMTLRLTDDLMEYVTKQADVYQISPSDFIRQCISLNKASQDKANDLLKSLSETITSNINKNMKEGIENGIDRKTDINNQL